MSRPVRVLVADDHPVMRAGITAALEESGFTVVAEAADAAGAVSAAIHYRPDVCLLDVYMPGDGITAVRGIRAALPDCAIVMLTVSEADSDLFDALLAGAKGYLLKSISAGRLGDALRGVLRGEAALPRRLTGRAIDSLFAAQRQSRAAGRQLGDALPGARRPTLLSRLSERELEVLELLLDDTTTSGIAMRLGISVVTVRRHVSSIMSVAGVSDRRSAIEVFRRELESTAAANHEPPPEKDVPT